MKSVKQIVAVVVWCLVSIGCLAGERNEVCYAMRADHPINVWAKNEYESSEKDGKNKAWSAISEEVSEKWNQEMSRYAEEISKNLEGELRESFLKDQKNWEASLPAQHEFIQKITYETIGSGSLLLVEINSLKNKLIRQRICQLGAYVDMSEQIVRNRPVNDK